MVQQVCMCVCRNPRNGPNACELRMKKRRGRQTVCNNTKSRPCKASSTTAASCIRCVRIMASAHVIAHYRAGHCASVVHSSVQLLLKAQKTIHVCLLHQLGREQQRVAVHQQLLCANSTTLKEKTFCDGCVESTLTKSNRITKRWSKSEQIHFMWL